MIMFNLVQKHVIIFSVNLQTVNVKSDLNMIRKTSFYMFIKRPTNFMVIHVIIRYRKTCFNTFVKWPTNYMLNHVITC